MASSPNARMSVEQFLAFDANAERRFEFHDGEAFEIESASLKHAKLCNRLAVLLSEAFPDCEAFDGSANVYVALFDEVVKPDAFVLCSERQVVSGLKGTGEALLNPTLVAEITSESTENYDKGRKADFYRSISSLQHYLVISQAQIEVQHYVRTGEDRWELHLYRSRDQAVKFAENRSIALEDLYGSIRFE